MNELKVFYVKKNTRCRVVSFNNVEAFLKRRLSSFGIYVGAMITPKEKTLFKKSLILETDSNCFAIEKELAEKIFVRQE